MANLSLSAAAAAALSLSPRLRLPRGQYGYRGHGHGSLTRDRDCDCHRRSDWHCPLRHRRWQCPVLGLPGRTASGRDWAHAGQGSSAAFTLPPPGQWSTPAAARAPRRRPRSRLTSHSDCHAGLSESRVPGLTGSLRRLEAGGASTAPGVTVTGGGTAPAPAAGPSRSAGVTVKT